MRRAVKCALSHAPEPVQRSAEQLVSEIRVARAVRGSVAQLDAAGSRGDLHLNLGCGGDLRPGWTNIDVWSDPPEVRDGVQLINHDLRTGLPLPTASAAVIYSSHFFEHLDFATGRSLMIDCCRTLREGGRFRMALPNLPEALAAYGRGDFSYFTELGGAVVHPYRSSQEEDILIADYLNYVVYQYGEHRAIYDVEKILQLLPSVGFREARISEYEAGIDVDDSLRRRYSFYVEATK